VDIKNTVGLNWTLPPEVVDKPCILIRSNEKTALCYLGLFVARPEYLSQGINRDRKKTIAKSGFEKIHWMLHGFPYPQNIWESADPAQVKRSFAFTMVQQRV